MIEVSSILAWGGILGVSHWQPHSQDKGQQYSREHYQTQFILISIVNTQHVLCILAVTLTCPKKTIVTVTTVMHF